MISELKARFKALVCRRTLFSSCTETARTSRCFGTSISIQIGHCSMPSTRTKPHSFPSSYIIDVREALTTLAIPFANLHAAGNDAHVCLRALLMTVARVAECQPRACHDVEVLLQIIRGRCSGSQPAYGWGDIKTTASSQPGGVGGTQSEEGEARGQSE